MSTGWRDISTAPRDGTRVLLRHKFGREFIGRFDEWSKGWHDDYEQERDPTHWSPLPPNPTTEPQR